jgi:hypothetical protein
VVLRTLIPLCGWVPIETVAIAKQGSWNFATVSTAKEAVCNKYPWSERSGDLPDF